MAALKTDVLFLCLSVFLRACKHASQRCNPIHATQTHEYTLPHPQFYNTTLIAPHSPHNPLSHRLKEIALLNARTTLIAHRLSQLCARSSSLDGAIQTAVAGRQINGLLVDGDFGRQELRVHGLFFAQALGGEATLFLGFRCGVLVGVCV